MARPYLRVQQTVAGVGSASTRLVWMEHSGELSMLMSAAVVLKCGRPNLQALALGSQLYVDDVQLALLQVWDMKTKKLKVELPGHSDEVFSVDWSPDGGSVASGGRDKVLKLWRH